MKFAVLGSLAAVMLTGLIPLAAQAGSARPELIKPATFGRVREVVGADLPVVMPRDGCPAALQPISGGPCFDKLKLTASSVRVLGLSMAAKPDARLIGDYGRDFHLYDVHQGDHGIEVKALPFATSEVQVPRDCYALKDEGIGYVISVADGATVAQESQFVVCGGGADRPAGPYEPQGAIIHSDSAGWHRSETILAEGTHRYLAVPGAACEPRYSLRTTYCAKPAVVYMDAHPEVNELDLVAAKASVKSGDIVTGKDLQQWVMKRKPKGYKADGRWFEKSMFTDGNGCWATEGLRWYVGDVTDGLDITEKAMSRCGAPAAPIPTAVYAVFGDDYFILNCAWDRRGDNSGGACAGQAADYLKRERRDSAVLVILNQSARVGDRLYDGGYISYDVVQAEMKDGKLRLKKDSDWLADNSVSESGCTATQTSDSQAKGFVIVRSLGISWARAYRWMDCPVY